MSLLKKENHAIAKNDRAMRPIYECPKIVSKRKSSRRLRKNLHHLYRRNSYTASDPPYSTLILHHLFGREIIFE